MRPGTLRVLEPDTDSHLIVSPAEGMVLWFGRNRPEVHICIGPDDLGVSRRHGTLEYRAGYWWVRALGGRPVRLGRSRQLWCGEEPVPLPGGRTSLQVEGTNPNEVYVVRLEVTGVSRSLPSLSLLPSVQCGRTTEEVHVYRLKPDERLVLTVIAQRVLRRDPGATLLTSKQAVAELVALAERKKLQPGAWTVKMVEHRVKDVRDRLAAQGVEGVKPEPGETGFDSVYRRNLVDELIRSGTLTPADLALLAIDDE